MAEFPMGAKVTGDTSSFVGAMGAARKGLAAFTGAAGLATIGIVALAGIMAGASIKAARDYQVELVKLNTLVGISTEQVEKWAQSMKTLAGETGRAPADLAKAMFAISSGGARGTAAMELLEHSAKASAIGLGDMSAIGRTAGAMLQAFGDEGLTAEAAIDVLTSTVREGNLEASSLAGAFSRVLGPAKAMGSSVQDIGAFMATFTRLGGSTEEASTSLLNVFNLLIKPPKQAREAMEGMGMSLEDIRATIEEDGLLAGLMMMKEGIGDNIDVLGEVIPNVRSLIGFLNTVGLQSESYAEIQGNVNDSLGLTAEGFDTWGDSAEAAHKRLGAEMKTMAITIGESLLPPLNTLLNKMAEWLHLVNEATTSTHGFVDPLDKAAKAVQDFAHAATMFDEVALEKQLTNAGQSAAKAENQIGILGRQLNRLKEEMPKGADMIIEPEYRTAAMDEWRTDINRLNAEIVNQQGTLAEWTGKLELLEDAKLALAKAIEEEANALVMAQIPSDEDKKAKEEREEAVQNLLDTLRDELYVLENSEAALVDLQMAEMKVGVEIRQTIQDLYDRIAATKASTREDEDAEKARKKAVKDAERDRETLRKAREREAEQREKAAQRLKDAELAEELREITRIAVEMADTIGTAFEDIISGTESVAAAFGTMVEEILKQVQRLLIQKLIVEPIVGAILGKWGPSASSASASPSASPSASVTPSGHDFTGLRSISVNALSRSGATNLGPNASAALTSSQVIVQQSITFAPQLIDGRDGARFVEQQAPTIAKIVRDAARQSSSYASSLR